MERINEVCDRLIRRLKLSGEFDNVRFVRAYGNRPVELPVRGVLAAVGITDISYSKADSRCTAGVEIRLYAKEGDGGDGLSSLAAIMLAQLERADSERLITGSGVSEIGFDRDLNTLFRKVYFTVNALPGAEDGSTAEADGVSVTGLWSSSVTEKTVCRDILEYLSEEPAAQVRTTEYILEFTLGDGEDAFRLSEAQTLGFGGYSYSGLSLEQLNCKAKNGGTVCTVKLRSGRRSVIDE